jgi:hypothetical protein
MNHRIVATIRNDALDRRPVADISLLKIKRCPVPQPLQITVRAIA